MNKSTSYKILENAVESLRKKEKDGETIDIVLDTTDWESRHIKECVSDILFNYFRHKVLIDGIINSLASKIKRKVYRVLATSLVQSFYQTGIPAQSVANIAVEYSSAFFGKSTAGFVNAIQRNALKKDILSWKKDLSLTSFIPPAVLKIWNQNFTKTEIIEFEKVFLKKANLTFRITGTLKEDEVFAIGAKRLDIPWSNSIYYEIENPKDLFKTTWISDGQIYIQDPTTSLAPNLIKVNENAKIWDTCSAPGGKALLLAAKVPNGSVVASDRSKKRQLRTSENVKNSLFENIVVKHENALESSFKDNEFDAILVDAPCSNSGVFRRRPDALWNYSMKKIKDLTDLQYDILLAVSKKLKIEGILVYSTCSIELKENKQVITKFLKENTDFILIEEVQLYPSDINDGGYAVAIKKI